MKVFQVTPDSINSVARGAVQMIRKGKVVVCPTDTVYGLVADAANAEAVQKVFQVKGREKGKPLPVFVKDIAMAKRFTHVSREQEKFLKNVWPGKVTVVLKSRKKLPKVKNHKYKNHKYLDLHLVPNNNRILKKTKILKIHFNQIQKNKNWKQIKNKFQIN